MTPKLWRIFVGIGSVILTAAVIFAVYWPAIHGGFIFDDILCILNNPWIKSPIGLRLFWTKPQEFFDFWPLSYSVLWIEWHRWGMETTGYHVTNIVLHVITTLFLYAVVRKIGLRGAGVIAAVFALHPVNVEAVAWIFQTKTTLAAALCFASFWTWLKFADAGKWRWFALCIVLFELGILSKTSVVTFPAIFLGALWWKNGRVTRREIWASVPLFVLGILGAGIGAWFQHNAAGVGDFVPPSTPLERLVNSGWVVWFYLLKAVVPMNLSLVYPKWQIDPSALLYYVPLINLLLWGIVLLAYRKTWGRPLLAAGGYFMAAICPVLGFVDLGFMRYSLVADHHQYMALPGLIALVVGLGAELMDRIPRYMREAKATVTAFLLLGFFFLTWQHARLFKDGETIWSDVMAKNPAAWVAYNNLGVEIHKRGDVQKASGLYKRAIEMNNTYLDAINNYGTALSDLGKPDEAIVQYRRAIELDQKNPWSFEGLGIALARKGETVEAKKYLESALRLRPDLESSHYNLGTILMWEKNYDEAIAHLNQALVSDPGYVKALINIGIIHDQKGDLPTAIGYYAEAVRRVPTFAEGYMNLAKAYLRIEKPREALSAVTEALKLQPSLSEEARPIAWVLATHPKAEVRMPDAALQIALVPCPNAQCENAVQLAAIAAALGSSGRFDDALKVVDKAQSIAEKTNDQALLAVFKGMREAYSTQRIYVIEQAK